MDALVLPGGLRLELVADLAAAAASWNLVLTGPGRTDAAQRAARWLVEQLTSDDVGVLANPDFQVRRFASLSSLPVAVGERPIPVDQTNRSVIVGEQVVVKWLRRIQHRPDPALTALAHLAQVRFAGTPATFGALTWRTPGPAGRQVPLAFATALLPGAQDGWDWCPAALESGDHDFPAALGRLTAQLHAAFATPSSVLPRPTRQLDQGSVRQWQATARRRLAEVAEQIGRVDDAGAGPDGDRLLHRPSEVLAANRTVIAAVLDRLLDLEGPTPVQRIHGDLHVGQVLTWSGGLAVIDFDGNPLPDPDDDPQASTARDVAQLSLSLDQVGRIVDRQSGFTRTTAINDWSGSARAQLLAGYQGELVALGRPELFDVRLLGPFVLEQACRDLQYSIRFLPRWAYATIDGLELILSTT